MAIEIQPRATRVSSGGTGRPAQRGGERASSGVQTPAPKRATTNFVPAPEALDGLIERAMSALRRGIAWDRGSILNLLV